MLTNYYTLRLIAHDLHRRLAGSVLADMFTQHKDELVVACASETTEQYIIISCDPARNYLVLREEFPRAKKNSVDLFSELRGARLQDIQVHPTDRQVILRTDTDYKLIIQLFGPKANVLLVSDAEVRDAFLRRKDYVGQQLKDRKAPTSPKSPNELLAFLSASKGELHAALKRCFPQFGTEAVREMVYLTTLDPAAAAPGITEEEAEKLFEAGRTIARLFDEQPAPRIYFDGGKAAAFSIIPLKHLGRLRCEEYDSIHTAIRTFLGAARKEKGFEDEKKPLMLQLDKVHKERLASLGGGVYFACTDMKSSDGAVYDLDFFMRRTEGGIETTEVAVHKKAGKARYGWKEENGIWKKVKS